MEVGKVYIVTDKDGSKIEVKEVDLKVNVKSGPKWKSGPQDSTGPKK